MGGRQDWKQDYAPATGELIFSGSMIFRADPADSR